ncbi:penicillin-binding protein, beta-lactamase class C [Mycolicibacterium rhodesiae NBB3]|uniref:Penicillin-binding protein, beta-lactamase class C n=1 Tax=Mycolicibacterium rhodesiae (strain NBB3) TaxID=710685 RepID=G8RSV7_MYCRN|nr:serine hydrolase domain-containing protein [Mycolicibacterium rhodesiae]AEV71579.1 penicillin-binding protein, beta-lactamase class C [Mycolicibacterium rhodesiae NBB3]
MIRTARLASLAMCVGLVFAGCSSTESNPALKPIDPTSFREVVEKAAKDLFVPGAMVVLRTPQGDFEAGVGTTELGAQTPPSGDTHFRIASNTKTFTSALIVLLAQEGRLAFSDPVSKYVRGVPDGENISIAQLLTMRSGLFNYTAATEFAEALDADPAKAWTPQEGLAIAFSHPREFAPGAEYEYNNTNFALLGLIAEKVGGRPLAEQFRERLFGPVGLTQTSIPAADDTSIPPPSSHGYMYGDSGYALRDEQYPPDMVAAIRAGTLQPVDYTNQNPSYATAAGGAISTAHDLATWIKALVSGTVFNADFQKQWLNSLQAEDPAAPDGQKYGYGISYQRFGPKAAMYYHGGELPGFNSFMGHDPDNDVTLVIWTNLTLSPDDQTTANAMLPKILKEVYTELNF